MLLHICLSGLESCGLYHAFLLLTKHILVPYKSKPQLRMISGENPLWHGIPTISPTTLGPQCHRRRQGANIQRSLVQRFELQTGRTVDSLRRKGCSNQLVKMLNNFFFGKHEISVKERDVNVQNISKHGLICRDHTWFYVNTTVISPKTNHFFSSQKETLLQCAHLTLSTGTIQPVLCLMLFRRSSWSKSSWATRKWWERWDCRQPLEW